MHGQPVLWHALLNRLAVIAREFLRVQIEAGAAAVQLFDSWAGALSRADYERYVLPHSRAVLEPLADAGVPRIHFGVGTNEFLDLIHAAGADVVGVDWRIPLDEAARRIGPGAVVQGNLDPALLLADWPVLEREVRRIVAEGRAAAGHIFNLGHGVLPDTDPAVITRVVELVHSLESLIVAGARIVVIGGGISGLSAAFRVRALLPDADVTVLEGSAEIGGKLRLGTVAGVAVDVGAEAMLARRPEGIALARDVGLENAVIAPLTTAARVRAGGASHPLPARTMMGIPADVDAVRASGC